MGGFGNIARTIGGAGNDFSNAQQALDQLRQKQIADQLANLQAKLGIQRTQQELQQNQQSLDPAARIAMLSKALGRPLTEQEKQTILGLPTIPKYSDVKMDAQGRPYGINSITGKYEYVPSDSNIQPLAPKAVAPKVLSVENVPYGVQRLGSDGQVHIFQPGDSEWTAEDAKLLGGATTASETGEARKSDLQKQREASYASTYAKMRGLVQQYSVIDKTTGEPTMVNSDTINANPGRYMAGALGQQLKNRSSVFDEIGYTSGQFDQALAALDDNDFAALPRAQIAAALQDRDPRSAMSQFIGSEVGTTLSPAQVDYVTGLAALQESAMSLRSIAGMGQGSDQLRNAILGMLPGAKTPSKLYAQRQMQLFSGEVAALRRAIPPAASLGMGGDQDNAPPAGSKIIPLDEFLKGK